MRGGDKTRAMTRIERANEDSIGMEGYPYTICATDQSLLRTFFFKTYEGTKINKTNNQRDLSPNSNDQSNPIPSVLPQNTRKRIESMFGFSPSGLTFVWLVFFIFGRCVFHDGTTWREHL